MDSQRIREPTRWPAGLQSSLYVLLCDGNEGVCGGRNVDGAQGSHPFACSSFRAVFTLPSAEPEGGEHS